MSEEKLVTRVPLHEAIEGLCDVLGEGRYPELIPLISASIAHLTNYEQLLLEDQIKDL